MAPGRSRREALRPALRRPPQDRLRAGVAKIAMHNREHIVILRPGKNGVLLHTMYYTHEIRQVDEFRTDLKSGEGKRTGPRDAT